MALDAATMKCLEEAKKGKPRRFVMVMKGERIVSMVLFKKGSLDKYKKQARDEGKGLVYHGVVDGKGQNIAFTLCRADGFEDAPGKDVKLKAYLKEEAGMQFKPVYKIVEELPTLGDLAVGDEESTSAPASSEKKPAAKPAAAEVEVDSTLADKLLEALTKMTPLIKKAVAAAPDQKTAILQPAAEIKAAVTEGRLDEAKAAIIKYGSFIKGLIASGSAPLSPATTATPGEPAGEATAAGLRIWQAARQDAVDQLSGVAKAIAATKDPDAKGAIIELQSIIKNLTASPTTSEQISELDRYLRTDDVVTAAEEAPVAFGPIQLREPLLKALSSLES